MYRSLSFRAKTRDPYAAAIREDTAYGSLLSQGRHRERLSNAKICQVAEDTAAETGVKRATQPRARAFPGRAHTCYGVPPKAQYRNARTSMAYEGQLAEMVKFQGFKDDRGDAYYARPARAG